MFGFWWRTKKRVEEFVRFFDIGEFLGGFIFVIYFEIKR